MHELIDSGLGNFAWHPIELGEHPDVLARCQEAVARRLSAGDHVDPLADRERVLRDIVARDKGLARGREEKCRENLDERRLPRAIRAEKAEELALTDLEGHTVQCGDGAAGLFLVRLGLAPPSLLFPGEYSGEIAGLNGVRHGGPIVLEAECGCRGPRRPAAAGIG